MSLLQRFLHRFRFLQLAVAIVASCCGPIESRAQPPQPPHQPEAPRPPSSTILPPPGGWQCDEKDARTTILSCKNAIVLDDGALRRLGNIVASRGINPSAPFYQEQLQFFTAKRARDHRTLQYVKLHPERFSTQPHN